MILPQTSKRISTLKKEGIEKRAALLKLVPEEFTAFDLAKAAGLPETSARAQIQKMLRWKEVEPTTGYKTPRTYRRIKNAN